MGKKKLKKRLRLAEKALESAATVHLVKVDGWDWNDEGWFPTDFSQTLAVCATREDAVLWIAEHGWRHVEHIADDLYDADDLPNREDAEYWNGGEFDEDQYRTDVLARMFTIDEVGVIHTTYERSL